MTMRLTYSTKLVARHKDRAPSNMATIKAKNANEARDIAMILAKVAPALHTATGANVSVAPCVTISDYEHGLITLNVDALPDYIEALQLAMNASEGR